MHEVLVNRLGCLNLPRKSVVRLTDRPDMTLDVYRGGKTTMQQCTLLCILLSCDTICDSSVFCMTAHDICANSAHDPVCE